MQHGYRGRTGIFEVAPIDESTAARISAGAPHQEIEKHIRKQGVQSMLVTPLRVDGIGLGFVCLDETSGPRRWTHATCVRVGEFLRRWVSPILFHSLVAAVQRQKSPLTVAEAEAVGLLAEGLSYIEIAQRLGKATRTVDNQLRSAREKVGARNAIELVRFTGALGELP
jgi:DNA-binding CsgD family transcriptional regulator